jgi:heme exporter protein A
MILCIKELAFERNNQRLFSQLTTTLVSGDLLEIRGKNGSGKSTLLRIIAGLIDHYEGNIFWNDHPIHRHRDQYTQQMHYVGHQLGIKPRLTVYENIACYAALMLKRPHPQFINTLLKKIHLSHAKNIPASHLSAGQLKRLSLARLLLHPTSLWLLDEPTTALDQEGQGLLSELLSHHFSEGGIAVIATHQKEALHSSSKTLFLEECHA